MPKSARTPLLDIAFEEHGPEDGEVVILMHGFPDDPRVWDGTVGPLAQAGWRVFAPWLRGYGPTRFHDAGTMRSGQQGAIGADLLAFMDALGVRRAALAGYDWGGRAACIVSALWPERVRCLVTVGGYNVQDIAGNARPGSPVQDYRYWYQWYLHTERGVAGLEQNRRELCRLMWQLWSPNWRFDDAVLNATAASFDNPDFVPISVHSYRHRYGVVPGDPAYNSIEARLASRPPITVPSFVLHGAADGVEAAERSERRDGFTGWYRREVIPRAGHFLPREAPEAIVDALQTVRAVAKESA